MSGFVWFRIYVSKGQSYRVFLVGFLIPFSARKERRKFDLPKIYQKLVEDLSIFEQTHLE